MEYLTEEAWLTFPCRIYKILKNTVKENPGIPKTKDHSELLELRMRALLVLLELGHTGSLIHIRKYDTTNKCVMLTLYLINIYLERKHLED